MYDHRERHHGKELAVPSESREDPQLHSSSRHLQTTNLNMAFKVGLLSLETLLELSKPLNNALIRNETEGVDKPPAYWWEAALRQDLDYRHPEANLEAHPQMIRPCRRVSSVWKRFMEMKVVTSSP